MSTDPTPTPRKQANILRRTKSRPQPTMKKQVFILAGQSNMSGRGGVHWSHGRYQWDGIVPEDCAPSPCILRLSAALSWEEAKDPLHIDIESKSKTCGVGPGMSFANCVLKEIGNAGGCTVIGLVPCAVGGTAIKEWEKGSKLYNQMVHRAKEAANIGDGGEIKAVLWYQGESDADSDHASEIYSDNLNKFIEDVRSDLEMPCLPFIQVALASGSKKNINKIRKAQLGLKLPNLVCVDAMGLPLNSDQLHLTTDAQVKLGKMLAEAYIAHFSAQSNSKTSLSRKLIMSHKAEDQRNECINSFFSNSYWRNRAVTSLVVFGSLLLYMVYNYCF